MGDSKVKDTAEVVRGIAEAVPVYNDLLQPAMRDLGRSLSSVAGLVRVAIAPVSALVWGYDRIAEFVNRRVSEHLQDVPSENIVSPPVNVAGPALENLRFTAEIPELREMYAKLLATAMDSRSEVRPHPSFVEIIRQMDPSDAHIIEYLAHRPLCALQVTAESPEDFSKFIVFNHFWDVDEVLEAGELEEADAYLQNLLRLGLIVVHTGDLRTDQGTPHNTQYAALLQKALATARMKGLLERHADLRPNMATRAVGLSRFGAQFTKACISNLSQPDAHPNSADVRDISGVGE